MPDRSPPTNVIPFRRDDVPPLGVASTAGTGQRLSGSRNEVWLCPAFTSSAQRVYLFIKPALTTRSIMAEAIAAIVGQCMGLPCPAPYIVTVDPRHIGRPAGPKPIAFGSEQVGSGASVFAVRDIDVMLALLNRQQITDALCAFDEFIANDVRGPADIVFDPAGQASIIDHEGAMQAAVRPGQAVTNWLADRVLERMTDAERRRLLAQLRAKAQRAQRRQWNLAPAAAQFLQDGVPVCNQLLEFLLKRLAHLDRLLALRTLPEQPYLTPESDDHAAGGTPQL